MCTTKTDRQYNQTATFSKKRFIGNAAVSQLVFAFLISLFSLIPSTVFAQLFISASSGSTDYLIPANINAISVTVKGGAGGTVSDGTCLGTGGKGVVFTARFNVNNVICPAVSLAGLTPRLKRTNALLSENLQLKRCETPPPNRAALA